jgi:hypothetical protein
VTDVSSVLSKSETKQNRSESITISISLLADRFWTNFNLSTSLNSERIKMSVSTSILTLENEHYSKHFQPKKTWFL